MPLKVSFFSNFLNHHQIPFSNEMYRLLGKDYTFVATEKIPQERLDLGYKDVSNQYGFAINSYQSEENEKRCMQLALESDVVIIGSAPENFVNERIKQGKLTFRYSERLFKKGTWRIINPRGMRSLYLAHTRYRKRSNVHILCASAYTPVDMHLLHAYPGRMWKWGYFPQVNDHDMDELYSRKAANIPRLLWAGRFLDWKQPEKAIKVAKRLKESGIDFRLDFIGIGPKENDLKYMTEKYSLGDEISFLGVMSPDMVRKHMEEANIFLFTSNQQEGWGAVLNESMNSGCAVVANRHIGSVPYLIKDGQNGFSYNNDRELYERIKDLLDNPLLTRGMGESAYKTMVKEWSPSVAAERIIQLSQALLNGNESSDLFPAGPCSRA
jgi:glycosyltransferase involved in cell wall biosynthesis